jgi:hypothetical protein
MVYSGTCSVVNVTCAYNTDFSTGSGLHFATGTTGRVTNSIVFFNGGDQIAGIPTVAYSDVQVPGTTNYPGTGNINGNPIFLSTNDLVIVPGSPCIDKGATNAAYNDVCFPPSLGKARNDMGAQGGPGAAPKLLARQGQPFKVELFGGVPRYTYLIQATTNLSPTLSDWQTLKQASNLHVGDIVSFSEPSTNALPQRFYRLNLAP